MIGRSPQPDAAAHPADVRRAVARHVFGRERDWDRVELCETHISWLFLAGESAFKLKKPVRFDFVDYSTAERRRQMCHEEVRLNRRLAPTIYLGVNALVADEPGLRIVDDRSGALDSLVAMRRYDERLTLAVAAEHDGIDDGQLTALAARLISFHTQAKPVRRRRGAVRTRREIRQNAGLDPIDLRSSCSGLSLCGRTLHPIAGGGACHP
jgi:aminoglycoside phosphotransferase family enzyme